LFGFVKKIDVSHPPHPPTTQQLSWCI